MSNPHPHLPLFSSHDRVKICPSFTKSFTSSSLRAIRSATRGTPAATATPDTHKCPSSSSEHSGATSSGIVSICLVLAIAVVAFFSPSYASAAVTFGAISAVDNAISRTSIAVSGTSPVGIVFVAGDDATDSITSVTWNSVAMTKINSTIEVPGDRWISAWCINNPASATTIAFNDNTDNYWRNYNAVYYGAVCPPVDSQNVGSISTNTAISVATTVVDAGSWVIMFQKDLTGGKTYSATNAISTMRANADAGGFAIADSNGATGSGSKTGTLTAAGNSNHGAIAFSLAPAAEATPTSVVGLIKSFWLF